MSAQAPDRITKGFIPVHIIQFQEQGLAFAKCREMNLVAHGRTEGEAIVKLMNMVTASLAVAFMRGNLDAVIQNSGMTILANQPVDVPASDEGLSWFLPVLADASPGAVG